MGQMSTCRPEAQLWVENCVPWTDTAATRGLRALPEEQTIVYIRATVDYLVCSGTG